VTKGFLVIEFIRGGARIHHPSVANPMHWERATRYVLGMTNGLRAVHEQGIVHRDITPMNILLGLTADQAVLADYGIAGPPDAGWSGTRGYWACQMRQGADSGPPSPKWSALKTVPPCPRPAGRAPGR
jgi:serine/threonine protein kinase